MKKELILASNSPRRKELLAELSCSFRVVNSDFEEKPFTTDPFLTAESFAYGKAKNVFDSLVDKCVLVLGADTVVYFDNKILGKPKTEEEAREMLKSLSGREHKVITGYALISKDESVKGSVCTIVKFNDLSNEVIESYLASGLYKGKAGSYGIQDNFPLVKSFNGSLNNVIGLPTETVFPIIKRMLNI